MSKVRNLDNTNLINLGYRIFTHQDQFNFAEFSNDFNPIHLDKKYARKTLPGTAIVHGLHAVLWSIELFLTKFRVFDKYNICRLLSFNSVAFSSSSKSLLHI